jgi:hypothetical protein
MKGLNVRFEETAVAAAAATETTMTTAVAPLPRGSHYAPTAAVRDCETRENVYCARFCSLEGAEDRLMRTFATCAGRRAEVYECEKSGAVTLVASFESGDANAALYACEWCAFDEEEEEDADADADAVGEDDDDDEDEASTVFSARRDGINNRDRGLRVREDVDESDRTRRRGERHRRAPARTESVGVGERRFERSFVAREDWGDDRDIRGESGTQERRVGGGFSRRAR